MRCDCIARPARCFAVQSHGMPSPVKQGPSDSANTQDSQQAESPAYPAHSMQALQQVSRWRPHGAGRLSRRQTSRALLGSQAGSILPQALTPCATANSRPGRTGCRPQKPSACATHLVNKDNPFSTLRQALQGCAS